MRDRTTADCRALGPLSTWPPEAVEFMEERAAIREVLGKMPRARAEDRAEADTRAWWPTRGQYGLPKMKRQ